MFGRNVSKVDVFQGGVASKINNEAHMLEILSVQIYTMMKGQYVRYAMKCMLNLTYYTTNLVCVHQMFYINCSIVIVCHCRKSVVVL